MAIFLIKELLCFFFFFCVFFFCCAISALSSTAILVNVSWDPSMVIFTPRILYLLRKERAWLKWLKLKDWLRSLLHRNVFNSGRCLYVLPVMTEWGRFQSMEDFFPSPSQVEVFVDSFIGEGEWLLMSTLLLSFSIAWTDAFLCINFSIAPMGMPCVLWLFLWAFFDPFECDLFPVIVFAFYCWMVCYCYVFVIHWMWCEIKLKKGRRLKEASTIISRGVRGVADGNNGCDWPNVSAS